MTHKTILLDLDGVLCDFVGGVCELFSQSQENLYRTWKAGDYQIQKGLCLSNTYFWKQIENCKDFWLNLKPYTWCKELYNLCKQYGEVIITTAPSLDPDCASQKIWWMVRNLGLSGYGFYDYMIGGHKHLLSNKNTVLIDDSDSNCAKFNLQNKGFAFTFPQRWNCWGVNNPKYLTHKKRLSQTKNFLERYAK